MRHDRVDKSGRVSLRYLSRLHHIGLGAAYRGQRVTLLIANKHIRVHHDDGTLVRELTLDLTHDYQALGTPSGRSRIAAGHDVSRQVVTISRDMTMAGESVSYSNFQTVQTRLGELTQAAQFELG